MSHILLLENYARILGNVGSIQDLEGILQVYDLQPPLIARVMDCIICPQERWQERLQELSKHLLFLLPSCLTLWIMNKNSSTRKLSFSQPTGERRQGYQRIRNKVLLASFISNNVKQTNRKKIQIINLKNIKIKNLFKW